MLLHYLFSLFHHTFRIWLRFHLYLVRNLVVSSPLSSLAKLSVLVPFARINFRQWLKKLIFLYGFGVFLTRGRLIFLFLFLQISGILFFLFLQRWLNIMHRNNTRLYMRHSLFSILACCCSVHKRFI